jgi:hypothetical protein
VKLAKLVEAERRGILSGRPLQLLAEARKRGLVSSPSNPVVDAVNDASRVNAELVQIVAKLADSTKAPIVNMPEQSAPIVKVAAPSVTVESTQVKKWRFEVERDDRGAILAINAEAIE